MFAEAECHNGYHHLLLDGGLGSFAFSESSERIWRDPRTAAWAWSSGVPHHVTVTAQEVSVVRWDRPGAEEFSRQSVENDLSAFYSYLVADRVQSTRRVVEHLVDVFQRTRSLIHGTVEDGAAVRAYLGILAKAINRAEVSHPISLPDPDLLASLPAATVDLLVARTLAASGHSLGHSKVCLLPDLAVRHAGSEIFQEAHFALVSAGDGDLLDGMSPAKSIRKTRGTSHFTPPALARSLVEQTFAELGDLSILPTLTVLDPACGSGSFLYEAVRTARRADFKGQLKLIGRDLSRAAVDMARFVLNFAARDWSPNGGIDVDIEVADALETEMPQVDAVLMNPPFMAWSVMNGALRDRVKQILGDAARGRGDISMAFVSRALDAVRPGGAIGAVMPASILASSAAEGWRSSIRDRADLRLVASLGEYGLFAYAAVNVAALVAKRHSARVRDDRDVVAVVGGRTPEATGDALRAIRGVADTVTYGTAQQSWQVFAVPQAVFDKAPTWRPFNPVVRQALSRLETLGLTRPLGEVFEVLQGARTGWVNGFVLNSAQLSALKKSEQRFFRPAAMGDNVVNGSLEKDRYVFFPYNEDGPLLASETDLHRELPEYFERYLLPRRDMLSHRKTHIGRSDWWTLARPRGWNSSSRARIVSKYFGGVGGFALDRDGAYVVVQGFGWFLRRTAANQQMNALIGISDDDEEQADFFEAEGAYEASNIREKDLLSAYVSLFNSNVFEQLLATFSSHVAGGQYDLSWRFVRHIPIPDFDLLWKREAQASEIARLIELGEEPDPEDRAWSRKVDRALHGFYGAELLALL
ncbi:class I SAM-dependent DNA methyltransferase [Roseomonas elaeocarpi]|uniref:site-specific DNA-methyltransferase (adenine-specific) n=1 Tax=Roseomonas elaeocarpi TaxID=907779 RepID=A0ABV6JVK0_9PROT